MNPNLESTAKALGPVLGRLRRLDPVEAVLAGHEVNEALLAAQGEVAAIRRSAIRTMRAEGFTLKEISDLVGMTIQRVHQLEQGYGKQEKKARERLY